MNWVGGAMQWMTLGLLAVPTVQVMGQQRPGAASQSQRFQVVVIGDMPYQAPNDPKRDSIQHAYEAVLQAVSRWPAAFVVHIGDITRAECTDSVYAQRAREFRTVRHPLVYTFGDNEWTDCGGSGKDPLERLSRLREVFTTGDSSLGRSPMRLQRQSVDPVFAPYRENVRWALRGITFLTIHSVGSNNNWGPDSSLPSAEFRARNAANLAWLRAGFEAATKARSQAVVVFTQANPGLNGPNTRYTVRPKPDGFKEWLDEFQRLAEEFGKPVALIHGDTHYFRVDYPFLNTATGLYDPKIIRGETFGNPNFHGLLLTIDPAASQVFSIVPFFVSKDSVR